MKMNIRIMIKIMEEVPVQVKQKIKSNNNHFQKNKLVDFAEDMMKNLMMNRLTYIIGKNVQC